MSAMRLQHISRRHFVQIAAISSLSSCTATQTPNPGAQVQALAELERRAGGKLGVSFLIPATGARFSHRGGERFGMASSFKFALAAIILREADQGRLSLATQLPIRQPDIAGHSPTVLDNLAKGSMSIEALARAAQMTSDNAATNVLLRLLGGPAVFTSKLRELGDTVTRLDRYEPDMMSVVPGDPRDTTTPDAMAQTMAQMLTTDWLSQGSRALLISWMEDTKTGLKRIRAGLPADWRAGDKTGTGLGEAPPIPDRYNDIAMAWPPSGDPMIITAFYESPVRSKTMRDEDMAVLASVGAIAVRWWGSLRA
jgi:beta-lactamase class A